MSSHGVLLSQHHLQRAGASNRAQTADSGIITLIYTHRAQLSRETAHRRCARWWEGLAVSMTRLFPQGPLRNKLAWPQTFWLNVIGHKGGGPTYRLSQRTIYIQCSTLSLLSIKIHDCTSRACIKSVCCVLIQNTFPAYRLLLHSSEQ